MPLAVFVVNRGEVSTHIGFIREHAQSDKLSKLRRRVAVVQVAAKLYFHAQSRRGRRLNIQIHGFVVQHRVVWVRVGQDFTPQNVLCQSHMGGCCAAAPGAFVGVERLGGVFLHLAQVFARQNDLSAARRQGKAATSSSVAPSPLRTSKNEQRQQAVQQKSNSPWKR